jgi:hypothetical protein
MPSAISRNERQSVCGSMVRKVMPRRKRLAIEYGKATPTKNEKEG